VTLTTGGLSRMNWSSISKDRATLVSPLNISDFNSLKT
jgi:hypothetical protein